MPDIFDEIDQSQDSSKRDIFDEVSSEKAAPEKRGLDWGQILSSGMEMGGGIAAPGSLESKAWSEAGIPQTESIAPELFAKLKFDINPEEPWYKAAAKAASNLAVGIPEFISSPAGISGVYSGMVAPGTTKAFFAADMIKNAIQQAPELMDQWGNMTPAQKAASAVDLIGSIALGAGLTKSVVGDVLKRYAPPAVKLARELETLEPEVKPGTPAAIRQLGVRVPEGPFAQPGIPGLASAALGERFQMVKPAGAPEEGALMDLRRAFEPPQVVAQPIARAERIQGGGEAPYGKVSFMRETEAPVPERTQAMLAEAEPKPAEPAPVEAAAPVAETAKAAEVKPPPPPSPEAQAKPAAAPTEAKTEVGEGKSKQPWEMTKNEFEKENRGKPYLKASIFERGEEEIKSAKEATNKLIERAKSGKPWSSDEVQSLADLLGVTIEKEKAYLMGRNTSGEAGAGKVLLRPNRMQAGKIKPESIGTVIHEIGHELLHQKSSQIPWEIEKGKPLVRGEWAEVEKMMRGKDRAPWHKNRKYYTAQTERYARLFELFLTRNSELKSKAPTLYSKMESLIGSSAPSVVRMREIYKPHYATGVSTIELAHRYEVKLALQEGKPVPHEVLAEHGLSPKQPPPQPSAGIEVKKTGAEGKESVTVYHGSDVPFESFDPSKIGTRTDPGFAGRGAYTTTDSAQAGRWGKNVLQTTITGGKWLKISGVSELYNRGLLEPMTEAENALPLSKRKSVYAKKVNRFTDSMIKQGYDGVEWTLPNGQKQYVLFKPENYKFKPSEKPESPTPGPGAQTVGETQPPQTKGIITGRAIEKWADDTLSGGATHLGPDVLAAYLVKGAALIERGIINFAEWSARMIAEHGDKVKPHLRELFTAAQETVSRSPVSETGTLKSAREIVEQRIAQSQAQPATAPTVTPVAVPTPSVVPAAAPTAQPTVAAQPGARPRAQVTLDDIYRIFEPAPKRPTPLKTKGINLIESIRTGFSSKFRPINQLAEDIAKAYGGAKKDIAGIFEQLKGSSGKGEADIYRFNRDVSSLVKGQEKDFNAYMFLNRSLDRLRQDLADIQTAMAGGNVPRLNRRSVAQYTIPQLESKLALLEQKLGPERIATFQRAASEYQRYMDQALRLQVESGRMSQDVYNAIKSGNQFYAPFKVMKYLEEGMKPEGTGRKIDTVADYTKAMEGIEDPDFRLGDMLGAARQSLLTSRILADKANAMRNIADLANIDTQKLFIRKLKSGEDVPLGMQGVNVFESGKKVRYATRPEVAEALEIYGNTGGGIISGILRGFSVPFKLGATALNVPFQISNLMADVPRQALVSKYGIRGVNDLVRYPLDLVHAIYSSMAGDIFGKENKLFLDFLDSGAAATTVQEHLTPKALQYRDPSAMSKSKRIALNILYSPAEFSTAIEQVSKILGVKRAMRFEGSQSGAELAKQVPEAITEIRRFSGSPDFGRQGKFVEQARLNLLYMFLNARIQGAVADLGRLTGRDGAKRAAVTWFRVGSAVGLPTAYLYALNNSSEFKSDYDKRPQQEKDNYWLIPKDSFITNEQGERIRDYWRIPKRESSKWIANMTESALNFAEKRDAKTFANFSQKMIEDISPVNIQGDTAQERLESVAASLNPVIKAPLELATGRDMYRHRELLGDTLKRASPEQQYTDRTATAFKVLADKIPDIAPDVLRSPIMLENITRNLTAGLLTQFLSKKPVEGRGKIENVALLQRFQAVPYTDNAEFTKQMQALERESADDYLRRHRAAQKLIEDNKGKTLSELIGKSSQDPKVLKQVIDLWMAKENGATSQDRRLIALPAKQRAQYIAKMLRPMTPAEKERAILDLAKKRVLTETVFQEMSQLPQ